MGIDPGALRELRERALTEFAGVADAGDLEKLRITWFGRKGLLTQQLRSIASLPAQQRPRAGARINALKQELAAAFEALLADCTAEADASPVLDIGLPGRGLGVGGLHPVRHMLRQVCSLLVGFGFTLEEGPELETERYNFSMLNIPAWHPARAMHDTFYLDIPAEDGDRALLRTHTSPVQARFLERRAAGMRNGEPLEVRIISPGRVYRADSDLTHAPMFHQVEGLAVGVDLNLSGLQGLVRTFIATLFADSVYLTAEGVRFRPSYFPFTEPSAEADMRCIRCAGSGRQREARCRVCSGTGWLEVMGCGMVHPRVFEAAGLDPQQHSGFAFGLGIERMAMLRYQIEDMRMLFNNNLDFLRAF